jgi:hypothetical protein
MTEQKNTATNANKLPKADFVRLNNWLEHIILILKTVLGLTIMIPILILFIVIFGSITIYERISGKQILPEVSY